MTSSAIAELDRPSRVACSDLLGGFFILNSDSILRRATIMALNRSCINVPFCFLIIPLLVFGFPYFSLAAFAASKWLVEVKLWQAPVCVDVRKLAVVGRNRRRMILLLNGSEAQNSLGLLQLLLAGIATCVEMLAHTCAIHNLILQFASLFYQLCSE